MYNNLDFETSTKLFIKGFTINANQNINSFKEVISSLCHNYEEKHFCDFDHTSVHSNFLGKRIGEIHVEKISFGKSRSWGLRNTSVSGPSKAGTFVQNSSNEDIFQESGFIGFVSLDNGYFVLKIVDNVYPAEIQFDLYLNNKMTDFQIIIDHLSAPALPTDGLGMFNYSYNVSYFTNQDSIISKQNKTIAPYKINSFNKENNGVVILNQLKEIECYFCNNTAKYSAFYGFPRKIIILCEEHKDFGSTKEFDFDPSLEDDIRDLESNKYKLIRDQNDLGNYSKNVKNDNSSD